MFNEKKKEEERYNKSIEILFSVFCMRRLFRVDSFEESCINLFLTTIYSDFGLCRPAELRVAPGFPRPSSHVPVADMWLVATISSY